MRRALGLLLLAIYVGADDGPYIPDGKLGFPLGTYLMIGGVRAKDDGAKGGNSRILMVDMVNDKTLATPVATIVDLRGALPSAGRIVVFGYETGRMVGVPAKVARKEGMPVPQTGWQFRRSFVITSWVTPERPKEDVSVPPPPPPPLSVVARPPTKHVGPTLEERLKRIRERQEALREERLKKERAEAGQE
jgi:hypothetical protein